MKLLIDTYKQTGNLHHAYLLEGSSEEILPKLYRFIEKDMKLDVQGNPDFWLGTFETFTIDDGRALQERQSKKALAEKKIYILSLRFITTEAQNSLLKMFEEPTEGTHFFVITPTAHILLPTLRSRLIIVPNSEQQENTSGDAKKFLAMHPGKRIAFIKELIEEKDKGKAIDFVSSLERELIKQKSDSKKMRSLEELLTIKKYFHDRSPSIKLLLEHLALLL